MNEEFYISPEKAEETFKKLENLLCSVIKANTELGLIVQALELERLGKIPANIAYLNKMEAEYMRKMIGLNLSGFMPLSCRVISFLEGFTEEKPKLLVKFSSYMTSIIYYSISLGGKLSTIENCDRIR